MTDGPRKVMHTIDEVVIQRRSARIVARDGLFVFESRRGRGWQREVGCDTLDEAVETAARHQVEQRFRCAHARIPLTDTTALVFVRQRWRLETKRGDRRRSVNGRVVSERGKSWPNIYRALLGGVRAGLVSREAGPLRRALFRIHVDAVSELRMGALATYPLDPLTPALEQQKTCCSGSRSEASAGVLLAQIRRWGWRHPSADKGVHQMDTLAAGAARVRAER